MAVAETKKKRRIGEILVDTGVVSPLEIDEALQRQRLSGELLGRILVNMGLCSEQDIVEALGVQQGMDRVDVSKIQVPDEVLSKVPGDTARFYNVAPVRFKENVLTVAMADPLNLGVLDDLQQVLGIEVQGAVSNPDDIAKFLETNYSFDSKSFSETLQSLVDRVGEGEMSAEEMGQQEVVADVDNLVALAQEPEVIKIVNLVLLEAVQKRASDIHFETFEGDFRVRIRVDGVLHEVIAPPMHLAIPLVSRIKVMCDMDISERRLPQDARIDIKVGESEIDIRVATLPTLWGESVVMRILDRSAVQLELPKLGFPPDILKPIHKIIQRPNGIFLVTGPTGSGKTTTLYGCLNVLNQPEVKIITTEDPVELQIERIVQIQVREDVGLTFAAALRSILRQDPDIVMVGEVRDLETAQIAVQASLTGHLVLSTLHTNSAPETITRLLDMELEPFLITSSLTAVLAQRLVRTLCRHCREAYKPDDEEKEILGLPAAWRKEERLRFFRPVGCAACDFVGYMGRVGIYELLEIDDGISDMILDRAMAQDIRRYARKKLGMRTLREAGLIKCQQGITSTTEVLLHTDRHDD
jgi:type IV pilus assembly protein PilB